MSHLSIWWTRTIPAAQHKAAEFKLEGVQYLLIRPSICWEYIQLHHQVSGKENNVNIFCLSLFFPQCNPSKYICIKSLRSKISSLACMENRQLQHQFPMLHCEADHAHITQMLAFSILMRTFKNSITIKLALLNVIRMLLRAFYYPISTGRKEYHAVNSIIFSCIFYKEGKGQAYDLSFSGENYEGSWHLWEFSTSSLELQESHFCQSLSVTTSF